MNYTEFVNTIQERVQWNMEKGEAVTQYEATKNNGVKRRGLVYKKEEINMSPTLYMEEFYEKYEEGESLDEIVERICTIFHQVGEKPPVPVEDAFEFEKIKDRIAYKLINRKWNEAMLNEIPHTVFEDLAMVPYVFFEDRDFGIATLQIRNEHLKSWGVEGEHVLETARKNSFQILPLQIGMLTEFMYVMTNSKGHFGAATLCYPNSLTQAYERLKENFFILPSSIHEVILVPESYGLYPDRMREVVKEINEIEVMEEEVLSNNIYYYDGRLKQMIMYS